MDEQTQKELVSWLVEKLQIKSEDELQMVLEEMGEDEMNQIFEVFTKERSAKANQLQPMQNGNLFAREGAKLKYLNKLKNKQGV